MYINNGLHKPFAFRILLSKGSKVISGEGGGEGVGVGGWMVMIGVGGNEGGSGSRSHTKSVCSRVVINLTLYILWYYYSSLNLILCFDSAISQEKFSSHIQFLLSIRTTK